MTVMARAVEAASDAALARFCGLPGDAPIDPSTVRRHAPDASWMLAGGDGEVVARCSLWWRSTPALPGHKVGLVGHWAAAGREAARDLLQVACDELAARGSTIAVAPMDGSTWRRYRVLADRGDEPRFFLEPDNPDEWPAYFVESGFETLARYVSTVNPELHRLEPRIPEIAARLGAEGIRIRTLRPERFDDELRRIHSVALAAFSENLLWSPIGLGEFLAQYSPLAAWIRPELVLLAERGERPVGFLFALPDLRQLGHRATIDTVVMKTLAVLPEEAGAGLGSLLTARGYEAARRLGYVRAIHALMHETNASTRIRATSTRTIRSYVLYAKALGGG